MSPTDEHEFEQFGPYVVYERLGVGGMATVHRAKERGIEGFERIVALKRLLPHLAEDESFVRAFVREAKLASMLQHANVVQLYELGRVGHQYFISMELIEGRDIRKILRQSKRITGPPPINVVVSMLTQLCDALDYAHTRDDENGMPLGLVHRDVSPSNVIVTTSGHVKVIDFGIAKAQSLHLRTQTGRVKGKLAYMAPEAIKGQDLDGRSDIFSAGVIAHELLSARPLFATKTDYHTLMRVQRAEVAPPSTLNRDCPPELDAIVLKALAREPEQRWQSAAAMRDALHDMRRTYQLNATNREVSAWLEWAFALEAPASGQHRAVSRSDSISESHSRSLSRSVSMSPISNSFPQVLFEAAELAEEEAQLQSPHTPHTGPMDYDRGASARGPVDADDEVIEIAWGSDEENVPVLLDDVPDVSEKLALAGGSADKSRRTARAAQAGSGGALSERVGESARIVGLPPPGPGDYAPTSWPSGTTPPPLLDSSFHSGEHTPVPAVGWSGDDGSQRHIATRSKPERMPDPERTAPKPTRAVTEFGAAIVERHASNGVRNIVIVAVVAVAAAALLFASRGKGAQTAAVTSTETATVNFAMEPDHATIEVQGHAAHTGSPFSVELEPGTYDVTVKGDGFISWVSAIEVTENENQTVRVALQQITAGAVAMGKVAIATTPAGLSVIVDGKQLEGTTPLELDLEPGERTIAITSEYGEVWTRTMSVAANTRYELQPDLKRALRDAKRRHKRDKHREHATDDDDDELASERRATVEYPDDSKAAGTTAGITLGTTSSRALGGIDLETVEPPETEPRPKKKTSHASVVVAPGVVSKISGDVPAIETRHNVSRIDAKLCIDEHGDVSKVTLLTKLPDDAQKLLRKTLESWRYEPYVQDGDAVPACFMVMFKTR